MQAFVFIIITFEFTGVLYTLFMFTIFHNNKGKDKDIGVIVCISTHTHTHISHSSEDTQVNTSYLWHLEIGDGV